ASAALSSSELLEMAAKSDPEAICISVVAPSTLIHARYLSAKLRAQLPHVKIVVGIWGATENMAGAGEPPRSSRAAGEGGAQQKTWRARENVSVLPVRTKWLCPSPKHWCSSRSFPFRLPMR